MKNKKPIVKKAASTPGKLRIIGGVFKRTPLPVAVLEGLRPTPERLRETLFNWLGGDLTGWHCLDLFAGTGALGFEAASRGATWVQLNENNRIAAQGLERSKQLLLSREGAQNLRLEVTAQDGRMLLKNWAGQKLDLVFVDPPFGQDAIYSDVLMALGQAKPATAAIYLEASKQWQDSDLAPYGWRCHKHSKVGAVHGHLLHPLVAQAEA